MHRCMREKAVMLEERAWAAVRNKTLLLKEGFED